MLNHTPQIRDEHTATLNMARSLCIGWEAPHVCLLHPGIAKEPGRRQKQPAELWHARSKHLLARL